MPLSPNFSTPVVRQSSAQDNFSAEEGSDGSIATQVAGGPLSTDYYKPIDQQNQPTAAKEVGALKYPDPALFTALNRESEAAASRGLPLIEKYIPLYNGVEQPVRMDQWKSILGNLERKFREGIISATDLADAASAVEDRMERNFNEILYPPEKQALRGKAYKNFLYQYEQHFVIQEWVHDLRFRVMARSGISGSRLTPTELSPVSSTTVEVSKGQAFFENIPWIKESRLKAFEVDPTSLTQPFETMIELYGYGIVTARDLYEVARYLSSPDFFGDSFRHISSLRKRGSQVKEDLQNMSALTRRAGKIAFELMMQSRTEQL